MALCCTGVEPEALGNAIAQGHAAANNWIQMNLDWFHSKELATHASSESCDLGQKFRRPLDFPEPHFPHLVTEARHALGILVS